MKKKKFYTAVILLSFLAIGIQPALAVINIPADTSVGTWDENNLIYTLNTDVSDTIILSNPFWDGDTNHTTEDEAKRLTFDGAGHTIELGTLDYGISFNQVDTSKNGYITIQNLNITDCDVGINIQNATRINVIDTNISSCDLGINIAISGTCIIKENTMWNCSEYGIWLINAVNNTIYNNKFFNKPNLQAIVLSGTEEPYSSGNVFDYEGIGNYWSDWSGSGEYTFTGGVDNFPLTDATAPVITCPGNITIVAMEPDGVPIDDERIVAFLAGASATDNYDPEPDITNNAPLDYFPPGLTTVTFTATDASGNLSTCQSTVTVVDTEGDLRIIPSIINREGRLQRILTVIRFPVGTAVEDIDIDTPMVLYPGDSYDGVEATSQRIVSWFRNGTLRVSVFATYLKDEVTALVPEDGPVEIMVIGRFDDGTYFYGLDDVRIISWSW